MKCKPISKSTVFAELNNLNVPCCKHSNPPPLRVNEALIDVLTASPASAKLKALAVLDYLTQQFPGEFFSTYYEGASTTTIEFLISTYYEGASTTTKLSSLLVHIMKEHVF